MPPSLQVYWQRFKQLKASEQRMLLFLGVFLGVLAVYALLWSPITSFQEVGSIFCMPFKSYFMLSITSTSASGSCEAAVTALPKQ